MEVIAIKMDGWWKIRKGDTEVYAPSAILRKKGLAETYKVWKLLRNTFNLI